MRIGVIFCAWQSEDLLAASLVPWVAARRARLGGHEYVICAVACPFVGFPQTPLDNTLPMLVDARDRHEIDGIVTQSEPIKETDARGRALGWLMAQGVDIIYQADADEYPTESDIARIMAFVEATPLTAWYRLSLKNLVFDEHTHLVEPFTPPRIHRARVGGYRVHSFWDDNNVTYGGVITRDLKRDVDFASMTVPKETAWVRHASWLSNERSRQKCAYQVSRGWLSSFRWDDQRGLCFNEAFYAKRGLPPPEVARD